MLLWILFTYDGGDQISYCFFIRFKWGQSILSILLNLDDVDEEEGNKIAGRSYENNTKRTSENKNQRFCFSSDSNHNNPKPNIEDILETEENREQVKISKKKVKMIHILCC